MGVAMKAVLREQMRRCRAHLNAMVNVPGDGPVPGMRYGLSASEDPVDLVQPKLCFLQGIQAAIRSPTLARCVRRPDVTVNQAGGRRREAHLPGLPPDFVSF